MPLTLLSLGTSGTVKAIRGKDDTRRFLENLGFVVGSPVSVISENGGNLIVSVKDSRIAISRAMAGRIVV